MKKVICPSCGGLLGFRLEKEEMPPTPITKVKVTIGDKEYPEMDISKLEEIDELTIICSNCGVKGGTLKRKCAWCEELKEVYSWRNGEWKEDKNYDPICKECYLIVTGNEMEISEHE